MSSSESTSKNNEKKQTRKQQLAEAKTLLQKAKEQLATNNSDWKGTVEKAATELEKQWQFTPADLDKSKQVSTEVQNGLSTQRKIFKSRILTNALFLVNIK